MENFSILISFVLSKTPLSSSREARALSGRENEISNGVNQGSRFFLL